MQIPLTLSFYIGRQFLSSIAIAMGVVMSVTGLIDFVELIRRTSNKPNIPFSAVLDMALMKMPYMAETILPYGILIGAMLALTKLTRSNELIVARASGISAWQFLAPLAIISAAIGVFVIVLFNPVSSAMVARYETLEGRYISGETSKLTISSSGLWLRQLNTSEDKKSKLPKLYNQQIYEYILHADKVAQDDMSMIGITIFVYGKDHKFVARMDAKGAKLAIGHWELADNMISAPSKTSTHHDNYKLPTDINISQIQDSFADPRTLSFWQLTGFIETLENAGFSALRHKVHWHSILSLPLLFCGMAMFAAVFSLRIHRNGKISIMIVSGLLVGFAINFLTSLFHAFGYSGSLPIILASWAPPAIVLMAAVAILLHLEDG